MKEELIETALHQIQVRVEPSTGNKLKIKHGCCLQMLFPLSAWAARLEHGLKISVV